MRKFKLALLLAMCCVSAAAGTPKVPMSMVFAGETIDLSSEERYERMDRELISFSYTHTISTLILKRSNRYFHIVEPVLKKHGLPDDLKYLMAIESNLDPKALSSAGAAGLWQFTKTTAKEYGLEIREGIDERYNILKETDAACRYLKKAYEKYGDWMTVAASYNAGQGGISTKLNDQHQSNAMDLWLVEETSRYMFRLLAMKMLIEHPEKFGFDISEEDKYPYIEPMRVVEVNSSISSLVDFAEENGVTYAQLKAANLWLRGIRMDNKDGKKYLITIPGTYRRSVTTHDESSTDSSNRNMLKSLF